MNDVFAPRPRLTALLCFVLLVTAALGFYRHLVLHPTDLVVGVHAEGLNDLTTQFLRFRNTPQILQGRFGAWSDWDPHLALGMPVHGNPQMALWYPPNWISLSLGAEATLSWLLVAHLWWSGVGCWLLARRWGLSVGSSVLSGVIAMAAPFAVAQAAEGHVAQIFTVAWIPWALWALDRFLVSDGQQWRWMPILLAASFFAGHVQELYYLVLLLSGTVFVVAISAWRHGERSRAGSLCWRWSVVGLLTVGIVAGDILPIWLNAKQCVRGEGLPLQVAGDGLRFSHLQQLFDPFALGHPANIEWMNSMGFYWEKLCYFGIAPLLLAIVGGVAQSRRSEVQRLAWQTGIAFLFAFGVQTPLFGLCFRVIPLMDSFRMPSRMLFFCSIGVALLAGFGLERLIGQRSSSLTSVESVPHPRPSWLLRVTVSMLAIAVTSFELGRHSDRVLAFAPVQSLRQDSEISRFLRTHASGYRVLAPLSLYSDLEAIRDGVRRVRGYEPVGQKRYAQMLDALFDVPDSQLDFAGFGEARLDSLNQPIADLLGIKYFVSSKQHEIPAGWKLVATGSVSPLIVPHGSEPTQTRFGIYENLSPLPRAFVIGQTQELAEFSDKQRVDELEKHDPRKVLLLDRDHTTDRSQAAFAPVTVARDVGDLITLRSTSEQAGYVVLTDLFHPGWSATVDGITAELLPADLSLRAVAVTPGDHEIEFRFDVPGRTLGGSVSFFSIALLLISLRMIPSKTAPLIR